MKNTIIIFLVVVFTGCKGQEKKNQEEKDKKEMVEQPPGQWEVNKEYDEAGNLIKYDSVYRYSYSNIEGDSVHVNLDSIMDSFKGYFGRHRPYKWDDRFSIFPETDSLFMNDFFRDDYFLDRWERRPMDMEQMMKRMDSIRNHFLKEFHPGLLESQEDDTEM